MRLCRPVQIAVNPFVTDDVEGLAAETGKRIEGPIERQVVYPAHRFVVRLRNSVADVDEQVVIEINVRFQEAEARVRETTVGRGVRAAHGVSRRAGAHGMTRMRLVKQTP